MVSNRAFDVDLHSLFFGRRSSNQVNLLIRDLPLVRILDIKRSDFDCDISLFIDIEDKSLEPFYLFFWEFFFDEIQKCELADAMQDDVDKLCTERWWYKAINCTDLKILGIFNDLILNPFDGLHSCSNAFIIDIIQIFFKKCTSYTSVEKLIHGFFQSFRNE